jgi:hypothetical protein
MGPQFRRNSKPEFPKESKPEAPSTEAALCDSSSGPDYLSQALLWSLNPHYPGQQLPPPTPQRTKETKTQALNPKSLLVPGHSQFSSNNNGNFGLILLFILFYFIIYYYYYYFFFSCTKLMSNYLVLADL